MPEAMPARTYSSTVSQREGQFDRLVGAGLLM